MNLRERRLIYSDKPDNCQRCALFVDCKSYKIPYRKMQTGSNGIVLIVGQDPGMTEDMHGQVFIGKSGQLLKKFVEEYLPDATVYVTNAVKCWNKTETKWTDRIRYCNDYLKEDIEELKPDITLSVGEKAKTALDILGVEHEHTLHPAAVLRGHSDEDIHLTFARVNAIIYDEIVLVPYQQSYEVGQKVKRVGFDTEWDADGRITMTGIATESKCTAFYTAPHANEFGELFIPGRELIGYNVVSDIEKIISNGYGKNVDIPHWTDALVLQRELLPHMHKAKLKETFALKWLMMERYWKNITPDMFVTADDERLKRYCAGDAFTALLLANKFKEDFKEEWDMMERAREIDMAMIVPVARMQLGGIKVDPTKVAKHQATVGQQLKQAETSIQQNYGVNPHSPQQVITKLNKLGFDVTSSDAAVLQDIEHSFARDVLRCRQLSTLSTRYLKELLTKLDNNGILHFTLNICGAATGRTSVHNPNLQNIPEELRDMFVSSFGSDGQLLSWDRSQAEYRVLAYLANYQPLIDAYSTGSDIHTWAAEFCGIPRRPAKNLNFAKVYGAGRNKLILMMIEGGMDKAEAISTVDKYIKATSGMDKYQRSVYSASQDTGMVVSPYGRIGKNLSYTQTINYPIQSFAGDLNKEGLIWLYKEMRRDHMASRIWLEFHDAIEIDCYLPEKPRLMELFKEIPQTIPDVLERDITMALPIDIKEHTEGWK